VIPPRSRELLYLQITRALIGGCKALPFSGRSKSSRLTAQTRVRAFLEKSASIRFARQFNQRISSTIDLAVGSLFSSAVENRPFAQSGQVGMQFASYAYGRAHPAAEEMQ